MATESVLTKTQPDFLCTKTDNDIWILEGTPTSFVELTLHSESQGTLSLPGNTASHLGSSQNTKDKNDTNLFPAILDFRRSSSAKTSTFGLLSEGFFNENDNNLGLNQNTSINKDKEETSDGMSSTVKSIANGDRYSGKEYTHKSKRKRKQGKTKKKSPVLKRSQTAYHLSQPAKSTDGASKLKFRVTAQGNVTADLSILTAQCKAVKIHQSFEPKNKISPINNSFSTKRLSIVSKPTDKSNQRTVSKSTNHITDSQFSKGDNTKKYCFSSPPSPVQLTRRSLSQAESVYLQRVTKVYLSEKHSGVIREEGTEFPCAPPATPTPEQLSRYEYVPSLKDVRSQRAVRQKLQVMERKEQLKEEKRKEEQAKIDRILQRDKESELRRRQRQEIYALNKIMTDLEHKRFLEFCQAKGIDT